MAHETTNQIYIYIIDIPMVSQKKVPNLNLPLVTLRGGFFWSKAVGPSAWCAMRAPSRRHGGSLTLNIYMYTNYNANIILICLIYVY